MKLTTFPSRNGKVQASVLTPLQTADFIARRKSQKLVVGVR